MSLRGKNMQLNKLVVDLAPKTSWQCFDLGCKVALANFKSLFVFWIVLTLPIFVLTISINIFWGFMLFWLCKPWYERGLLYILSAAVLGKKVTLRQALLKLPSQVKPLWFSSITYRRLAPSRSFDMAVVQLENLSGERRRNRLKVLHKSRDDNTAWWTICCVHWELFFCIGLLSLIQMLMPTSISFFDMIALLSIEDSFQSYIFYTTYYAAIAIVAPFYVAGGFVAYLNRRVILEGWDIEIGFTKWRHSFLENETTSKPKASLLKTVSIALTFLCATMLIESDPAFAQTSSISNGLQKEIVQENSALSPPQLTAQQIKELEQQEQKKAQFEKAKQPIRDNIETLLENDPFAQYETVTGYRVKGSDEENDKDDAEAEYPFISSIVAIIAKFMEVILWGIFIFTFGYLIVRNWFHISAYFDKATIKEDNTQLPTFISTVFTENLTGNITELVNTCINNKEYRRALSILVQTSLTYLTKEEGLKITKSMTEKECLVQIKLSTGPVVYEYMQNLFSVWMTMAWAHQLPQATTLRELSDQYNRLFAETVDIVTSSEKNEGQ